jgi:hypothetical protein
VRERGQRSVPLFGPDASRLDRAFNPHRSADLRPLRRGRHANRTTRGKFGAASWINAPVGRDGRGAGENLALCSAPRGLLFADVTDPHLAGCPAASVGLLPTSLRAVRPSARARSQELAALEASSRGVIPQPTLCRLSPRLVAAAPRVASAADAVVFVENGHERDPTGRSGRYGSSPGENRRLRGRRARATKKGPSLTRARRDVADASPAAPNRSRRSTRISS